MIIPILLLAQVTIINPPEVGIIGTPLPIAIGGTSRVPAAFGMLQRPGKISSNGSEFLKICGVGQLPSIAELDERDARLTDSVKKKMLTPATRTALACTRSLLAAATIAEKKADPDWDGDAIDVLKDAAKAGPLDDTALDLLAVHALRDRGLSRDKDVAAIFTKAIAAGKKSPIMLRACSYVGVSTKDKALTSRCAAAGVAAGSDSTWHLILIAREQFAAGDTTGGQKSFYAAVSAAHDSLAITELAWHLQWFLDSREMESLNKSSDAVRGKMVRDFLIKRDIRDGKSIGARLAEHFRRLAVVEKEYTTKPAKAFGDKGLNGAVAGANPYSSSQVRDAQRWQSDIDDRGVVFMRFGDPVWRRVTSREYCVAPPARCTTASDRLLNVRRLAREDWNYRFRVGSDSVLLHFEEEWFDGSVGATTLKGNYRPMLTSIAQTDDNTVWPDHVIKMAGTLYRIWDPVKETPMLLLPYAMALSDLQKTAKQVSVDLTLRQWSATTSEWSDTTLKRTVDLSGAAEGDLFSGVLGMPSTMTLSTWSLFAEQGKNRGGRLYRTGLPQISTGALMLSDVVLGVESQRINWQVGDTRIVLAHSDVLPRNEPLDLFFQIKSTATYNDASVALSIGKTNLAQNDTTSVFKVSFNHPIGQGLSNISRKVELSRLSPGDYQIQIMIMIGNGRVVANKWTSITLK